MENLEGGGPKGHMAVRGKTGKIKYWRVKDKRFTHHKKKSAAARKRSAMMRKKRSGSKSPKRK